MLSQASHINIVKIQGYTTWKSSVAIVMEYLLGGNLGALLLEKVDKELKYEIPSNLKLQLCADISSGIAYLHNGSNKEQVIHGNLKPINILLTANMRCKVGGFATAEVAGNYKPSQGSSINENSKEFIAPERISNPFEKLEPSMDVYSYGVIVYVMLERRNPKNNFEDFVIESKSLNSDDSNVTLLTGHLKSCCDEQPTKRPKMIDIRNETLQVFCEEDISAITKHVASIQDRMQLKAPYLNKEKCTPLDSFISKI